MNILERIKDRITGKAPKGAKRSSKWRKVRATYLAENPECEACGRTNKTTVHHIVPFHIAPHLELDPTNLMTLCENKKNGIHCHLLIGHKGNFRKAAANPEMMAHMMRSFLD